ncbi:hypothetical protein [Variovorax sp. YR566]|uniref:hypothetical protein n=1 Tax=Variovorax sp. YR566 TaxID=3450237 RepID=UPI003F81AF78
MNRQGVLAATARPDPLLETPVQVRPPPIALAESVPVLVAEVPPQIVTVPTLTVQVMPVPPVALPTAPMPAVQTQTQPTQPQRQFRYNPTAAEYIPPSVLRDWQRDEAEFNKQLEWATAFGVDLQNLRDRSSELNHRSTLLIPNSEEHQLNYEESAAFFNWFREHCNAGLHHVGIHLDQQKNFLEKPEPPRPKRLLPI